MTQRTNEFGQPIGDELPGWKGAPRPPRTPIEGRYCRIEPLDPERHLDDLWEAYADDPDGKLWTYMFSGPFATRDDLYAWMGPASQTNDPFFHALIELPSGKAVGIAAYMRIKPEHGVIEVGSITYSHRLQRTPAATEAMYLMMKRAFNELGYRRYEWKCDALNSASCRAAERLGFSYDGLFEQSIIYKGRSRDTAWFSIIDRDWPAIEEALVKWLDLENFDQDLRQKRRLQEWMPVPRRLRR